MQTAYEGQDAIDFSTFSGSATGVAFRPNRIGFEGDTTFSKTSSSVPTGQELDALLALAFEEPQVGIFLTMLKELPPDNPFSTVTNVVYSSSRGSEEERTESRFSRSLIFVTAGLSILFCIQGFLYIAFKQRLRYHNSKSRAAHLQKGYIDIEGQSSDSTFPILESCSKTHSYDGDDQIEIEFRLDEEALQGPSERDPLFQAPFDRTQVETGVIWEGDPLFQAPYNRTQVEMGEI